MDENIAGLNVVASVGRHGPCLLPARTSEEVPIAPEVQGEMGRRLLREGGVGSGRQRDARRPTGRCRPSRREPSDTLREKEETLPPGEDAAPPPGYGGEVNAIHEERILRSDFLQEKQRGGAESKFTPFSPLSLLWKFLGSCSHRISLMIRVGGVLLIFSISMLTVSPAFSRDGRVAREPRRAACR